MRGLSLLLLALLQGGAGAAGLADCRPAAESGPACRAAQALARPEALLALAESWAAEGQLAPALALLEAAARRSPEHPGLRQRLQELRSLLEERAWAARQRSGASAPTELDRELLEIRCTRLSGEPALAACEQALQREPEQARLWVARGDHLLTLGRPAEAEQSYQAAAQRDPGLSLGAKIATASALRSPGPAQPGLGDAAALGGIAFGRYHALLIGNNAYRHLERLQTAVNDAKVLAELLRSHYGFEVTLLTDASRAEIVEVLDEFRARLKPSDNLLIYYAGHGWLDAEADKGFWLPVDAREDRRTQWVSNDTVRDALRALKAKHVLVVADSCFSGTLVRGPAQRTSRGRDYVARMARLKARQVLSSGGLEPVADSSGSGHSPFAAALIAALRANPGVLDATALFNELRRPVALNSEQLPQFADIRMAGHEGGDFLFVRGR